MGTVINLPVEKRDPMTEEQANFFYYLERMNGKSDKAQIINLGLIKAIRKTLSDREFWKGK